MIHSSHLIIIINANTFFMILETSLKVIDYFCIKAPSFIFEWVTAWKVSVFGVFLVGIFLHSNWIRRDIPYLSVFSQNARKYGTEKLRIQVLFTQWVLNIPLNWNINFWVAMRSIWNVSKYREYFVTYLPR